MRFSAGFSVEYPEELNVGEMFDFGFSLIESLIQDKQQGTQKRKNFTGSLAFAKSTWAQQRLNQLNVPKKEDKIRVIEEYIEGIFGERYTKKNILAVLEELRSEIDSSLPFQILRLHNKNFLIFYSITWVNSIEECHPSHFNPNKSIFLMFSYLFFSYFPKLRPK